MLSKGTLSPEKRSTLSKRGEKGSFFLSCTLEEEAAANNWCLHKGQKVAAAADSFPRSFFIPRASST